MSDNKKITTGANDRPQDSSIAQSASGLPDDSSLPVDVDEDQVNVLRDALGIDAEQPEQSDSERSPARQKDQERDMPQGDADAGDGAEEITGAGPNEDTYD